MVQGENTHIQSIQAQITDPNLTYIDTAEDVGIATLDTALHPSASKLMNIVEGLLCFNLYEQVSESPTNKKAQEQLKNIPH